MLLLMSLGLLTGISAFLLAGLVGVMAVAILLVAMAAVAPQLPADTLLRLYRARLVPPDDGQLSSLVDVIAWRAGLTRRPDLYLIPSLTIHAFAAGTAERPAIAISEGLVRRLTLREIAGVMAHEMSHIRNGDLWIMGLADATARVLQGLAYLAIGLAGVNLIIQLRGGETMSWAAIALLYLTPAIVNLLQLTLSRSREYEADRGAAELIGSGRPLASALQKIEAIAHQRPMAVQPAQASHYIHNPLAEARSSRGGQPNNMAKLFSTHPPTEERIRRLLEI
jgi:heat shock protein HtpX